MRRENFVLEKFVCPFPGWHLAWVVKVVVPSCISEPLELGFCLPGMALGVHRYRLAQGSGWSFLPELQLAKSYSYFGKSVWGHPIGTAFLRYCLVQWQLEGKQKFS